MTINKKSIVLTFVGFVVLFLAAQTYSYLLLKKHYPIINIETEQMEFPEKEDAGIEESAAEEVVEEDSLAEGVTLEDDKIFFYGKEVGYIEDGFIRIKFGNGYISFKGELGKITPYPFERESGFFYDGLEISDTIACRYGICKFYEKLNYECNGPIIKSEDIVTPQWDGCQSNNKDYLTQYEFDAGNGNGFATGAEVDFSWYKFYMRKLGDTDLYFFGNLGEPWWEGNINPNAEHIKTKTYLNEILQDETNKQTVARWDAFVSDLCYEDTDNITDVPEMGREGIVAWKPVIYLYPKNIQETRIRLDYKGTLTTTYPVYDDDWEMTAYPDGRLIDLKDGKEYSYLFWEGEYNEEIAYDMKEGFVIKGEDTADFLQDTLSRMGLTPKEYNKFIVYWMPRMQNNKYNLIHFASKEEYDNYARLTIEPEPDSILRIFMVYKVLDDWQEVKPQRVSPFVREGFTVVEWGGTKIK